MNKTFVDFLPLPDEALFIGVVDEDGYPLLLSMLDENVTSVLFAAEADAGKTNFLKSIADYVYYDKRNVEQFVVTYFSDKWSRMYPDSKYSISSNSGKNFFHRLVYKYTIQSKFTLLLIDDIDFVYNELDTENRNCLLWILENGSKYGFRVIATISDYGLENNYELTDCFKAYLVGRIGRVSDTRISELNAGQGYVYKDGSPEKLVNKFTIPYIKD